MAARGLRCLGVGLAGAFPGTRIVPRTADERDLVLVGFCVFVDPPKQSAAEAVIRGSQALGVQVKIISGDAPPVVRHWSRRWAAGRGLTTGAEIDDLTELALVGPGVETCDLFARVSPDQKTRIIRALRARGHTVGFSATASTTRRRFTPRMCGVVGRRRDRCGARARPT